MQELLNKLYELFKETNDTYVKGYIWTVFSNFSVYYKNNDEIQKMFNDISRACQVILKEIKINDSFMKDEKNEFVYNNQILIKMIPNYLSVIENEMDKNRHSSEELEYFLKLFLHKIRDNLLMFYEEMKSEGRIVILDNKKNDGYTGFTSITDSKNFICINKLETYDDVKVLIHEIGHAYYNYCNNIKLIDIQNLDLKIKSEIPSILLERLFSIYYSKYFKVNKYVNIEKLKINSFNDLMYSYGKYISSLFIENINSKIIDKEIKIEDIYQEIYNTNYQELIDVSRNNKGLVK